MFRIEKKMSRCRSESLRGGARRENFLLEGHLKRVKETVDWYFKKEKLTVKDLGGGEWSNKNDTLIVRLKSSKDIATAVNLALTMREEYNADEIHVKKASSGLYMRFWWD